MFGPDGVPVPTSTCAPGSPDRSATSGAAGESGQGRKQETALAF